MRATRRGRLVLVVLGAIGCAGCTVVQVSHYLSPSAAGAISSRDPLSPDVATILSGPANSLQLEMEGLRVGFSCWNQGYTPLLIGPLVFPVLPIFLLAPLLREPLETDPLEIAVQIEPVGEALDFIPGKVEVVDAEGIALQIRGLHRGPGGSPRINHSVYVPPPNEVSADESMVLTEPTLFVFEFAAASDLERPRFEVTIGGLSRSGSKVTLPVIELAAGGGLEVQMGP